MKILLLCRSLDIGGTQRQLVTLAKGLHREGHDVSVVEFYAGGSLEADLHAVGIPVFDLRKSGRWDLLRFLMRVVSIVWKLRPQVLYSFLGTPNILTAFLKPFFPRVRMVWGVRASNVDLSHYDWLARLTYRVECRLSRFADLIICNSRAGLEYAAGHGFPRDRMTVIPNGIDITRFKPDADARRNIRAEWGIGEDSIVIGLIARLDPIKDHPTFLRAAAMLAQERADVRFVCVGDGPRDYSRQLRQLASDLGLNGRLIWADERNDIAAAYSAFDIASSSSSSEGFSNTIAEAMACGVPCVVTDVGDSALIVGRVGVTVAPASPDALLEGFRLGLDKLTPTIRNEARLSIINRFTNALLVSHTAKAILEIG